MNEEIERMKAEKRLLEERLREAHKIVKAVAHVGIDFGYGVYELEPYLIDEARELFTENEKLFAEMKRMGDE